ncbi:RCC1 domain-containing protein [Drepanopeziza brunnea f. sp. 'multigermtubi' MB_m1]|uniref:RCC1 domain-containing protein n=1 Tax=Marssonina brunnea f. sp. multigermtubi (strain MB_m1) TaxID=1072389 RepID=K1WR27_MARBU|nr:RCC1 domain-containing protein [Drepanopeziza brunnea f. sp. 'multigermtubi' MB_m1]EKD14832.1 RCC1 domain-containing protein [Drepanopeziza brunnea f. sp. 'multigermtubi' MB_m1]
MATIYAIGSNGSGQLGIGHKEDVSVPKQVLFDPDTQINGVTQIKAGGNHTLLLASGILYCSGDHTSGACGLLPSHKVLESHFHLVRSNADETISRVAFCAASWESSIIVQRDQNGQATQVYTFGTGHKGELGLEEPIFRSSKAQLVNNFPPEGLEIVDLAASVSHIVAVLSNGEVYGWGNGRKGQLGQPEEVIYEPRKITGVDFKVVRAVCGREFTYLVGESQLGQHVVLGSEKWDVRSTAPQSVAGWKDAGATWGSIFVLLKDGKLLSWGRDDHGQLAPPGLPPLSQIAIGSEHALGLTTDGKVLAWGWGEHGNCGPSTTDGDVKGKWNTIASSQYLPPGSKISSIGAGCATSWVCVST